MVTWIGSPNHTTGRQGSGIDRIYIHWMVGTLAATDSVFQDTTRQTSAHYGIEDGNVHQYVDEANTAYHAGTWSENLRSIGIEHSAAPGRDASVATLETSAQLIAEICQRRGIPCDRAHIRKHSENIPTQCPGSIPIDWLVTRANQIIGGKAVADKINRTELEWHYRLLAGREAGQDELNELMRKTDQGLGYHQLTEEMKTWFQQRGEGYYQYRDRAESQIADLKRQLEASSAALAAVNGEKDKLVQDNRKLLEDIAVANAKVSESEGSLAENIKMNEQAKKAADNFFTALLSKLFDRFK